MYEQSQEGGEVAWFPAGIAGPSVDRGREGVHRTAFNVHVPVFILPSFFSFLNANTLGRTSDLRLLPPCDLSASATQAAHLSGLWVLTSGMQELTTGHVV